MARRSSPGRTGFGELRTAAVVGDAEAFGRHLGELLARDTFGCVDKIRQGEVLLACRSPERRAEIRRAYLDTLLRVRVPEALIRQEAIYVSYCEVIAEIRDEVARGASATASSLRRLGRVDAVEACTRVVASRIRRFLAIAARAHKSDPDRSSLKTAATLSDVSHEIGGLHSLLPLMINELFRCRAERDPEAEIRAGGWTLGSARNLLRIAENWQTLSYLRQRVAFGEIQVERVEQGHDGPHVFVVPRRIHEAWQQPSAERRLANMRMHRRLVEPALASFPIDLGRLVEATALLLPAVHDVTAASNATVIALKNEVAATIRAVDIVLITEAEAAAAATTLALWATQLIANAIDIFAHFALKADAVHARRWRFTLSFEKSALRQVIAECARVPTPVADDALSSLTTTPNTTPATDLSTRPFVDLDRERVFLLRNPFGLSDPFMETRRTLASKNATSAFLGAAYEKYVRSLLSAGGFQVAPGRNVLDHEGHQVTDVDVLAYKDGVAFVIQAKCLPEPDSIHSLWKAREHVNAGIRQCLTARAYLRSHPTRVLSMLGLPPSASTELCCAVVTPCIRFSGDCVWPVAVVDDMYLDHVLTVGELRQRDHTGQVVSTHRLYPGAQPSGAELRNLLLTPRPLRSMHSGDGGLRRIRRRIGPVTVTEFIGHDGLGLWESEPA